jgi:hypothetical protein
VARDGSDDRFDAREPEPARSQASADGTLDLPMDRLRLPQARRRERVSAGDRTYQLRGSESRLLATLGAFRVVPVGDLTDSSPSPGRVSGDVRSLADQGLVARAHVVVNAQPTTVLVLTREAKDLLDRHRVDGEDGRSQTYHAGLVKPRELAHDAQLYRLYRAEAARIVDEGGTVRRVVLDYELKRDYQRHLHRAQRPEDGSLDEARRAFAESSELPLVDGHLQFPDLRIEYDTPDGDVRYRDVELVTEHYSRSQLAAKSAAGFRLYRAGGPSRRAGTPHDPQHLEWLT